MFVKQYGAKRTGTNALRLLLERQFDDLHVLMHILGDKHSLPTQLVLRREIDWSRSAQDLIIEATLEKPAETTQKEDGQQLDYILRLAETLKEILAENSLYCIVSIKDPYAWLNSMMRIKGLLLYPLDSKLYRPLSAAKLSDLRHECRNYNHLYSGWLACVEQHPQWWTVVRFEDLISDIQGTFQHLASWLGMKMLLPDVLPLPEIALPAHWDNTSKITHFETFDPSFYTNRQYLSEMDREAICIVEEEIDWDLVAIWGYRPLPPTQFQWCSQ